LDFYKGVDMAFHFWNGHGWVITFFEEHRETLRNVLEERSQDWVSQEDERYEDDAPWRLLRRRRTLRDIAHRHYSGAGMVAWP
jgi:hypothetical protein